MSGWREISLGDFVGLQRGHDLTESERSPGRVPVMGSAGMNGYHSIAKAKGPGVVVGRSGASFGQVHYCPTDYWPHNTALYVTDFRGNDTRFTYYFLKSIDFSRYNSGSAQASLNRNFIYPIRVCIPEPREQRAIALVLGSLDDKIELNRRMNETLEALAQSLFKSWFVDATQSALPKGWTERALYDCADYINGAAFRNEHFSADRQGLPVIKIGELKDGITAQTKFCKLEREPKYRINSGEILFSWSGSPDTSIDTFIWTEGEGWLNQHIFKIQFKRPIEKFFVYYLLRHLKPVFIEIARDKQTTGLGHVTAQDLKRLKTAFPPDDLLQKFNCVVEPLFQKVYTNLHESRTLAALRDALLPKLLSGELRVPAVI